MVSLSCNSIGRHPQLHTTQLHHTSWWLTTRGEHMLSAPASVLQGEQGLGCGGEARCSAAVPAGTMMQVLLADASEAGGAQRLPPMLSRQHLHCVCTDCTHGGVGGVGGGGKVPCRPARTMFGNHWSTGCNIIISKFAVLVGMWKACALGGRSLQVASVTSRLWCTYGFPLGASVDRWRMSIICTPAHWQSLAASMVSSYES